MNWISDIELLSTRNMQCFVALVETGSAQAAATQLNITSLVVRSRSKALARSLGHELFTRTTTGHIPTEMGLHVYGICKQSLERLNQVEDEIKQMATERPVAGCLRMAIHPSLASAIIPSVLSPLLAAHPALEVVALEAVGDTMLSSLEGGEIDLAIGLPDVPHWWITSLAGIEHQLVLCSAKPLEAGVSGCLGLADLASLKLVQHNLSATYLPTTAAQDGGVNCPPLFRVEGFLAAIDFVRQSDWCSLVPLSAIIDEVEAGELHAYAIYPPLVDRLVIAHHTDVPMREPAKAMFVAIQAMLERLNARVAAHMKYLGHAAP